MIASNTAADWLVADPDDFRFDAFRLQGLGDLAQGGKRVAVLARRTVDKDYFHRIVFMYS